MGEGEQCYAACPPMALPAAAGKRSEQRQQAVALNLNQAVAAGPSAFASDGPGCSQLFHERSFGPRDSAGERYFSARPTYRNGGATRRGMRIPLTP